MPIYEYQCADCKEEFEELAYGNDVPPCPHCGSGKTSKLMSRPCRHVAGGAGGNGHGPSPSGGGGGCAGCSGGNCATCG